MSKRLGETLVELGKLTEAELHKALTSQLVFGGHLGSSLLELGYIDEETLGATLSRLLAVPYADAERLASIPSAVVRCLPLRLVEKHRVVPLGLDVRTLDLAMIDPKNLAAIDEISFVTGYRIVPWVAPEVRILQAMERHYGLQRPQRFLWLAEDLGRRAVRHGQPESSAAAQIAQTATIAGSAHAAGARLPAEGGVDHWEKYGYGRSWQDVAELLEGTTQNDPAASVRTDEEDTRPHRLVTAPAPEKVVEPPKRQLLSLMEASRRFAEATSVEEIVATTLDFAEDRMVRTIFFVVKGDRAIGWSGRDAARAIDRMDTLTLPLAGGASVLGVAGSGGPCYLGPVPAGSQAAGLYDRLGVPPPRTILVSPIHVTGRVAAYLYGDSGETVVLNVELPAVLTLCARVGLALQILLLRNKILAG